MTRKTEVEEDTIYKAYLEKTVWDTIREYVRQSILEDLSEEINMLENQLEELKNGRNRG